MENLICNVELNGKEVRAQLSADFWWDMFQGGTNVSEDVVKQTAQQIYNAVKKEDKKDTRYVVRIEAEFKDDYLKGLIDADYSEDFVPIDEPVEYEVYESGYTNKFIEEQRREQWKENIRKAIYENDYSGIDSEPDTDEVDEYPYDIKGSRVEYDRYEVQRGILNEYEKFYGGDNEYAYSEWVSDELEEMGFEELCEQKGIEVEIDYYYGDEDLNVSYYDDLFHFKTWVKLNFYERDDE